MDLSRCHELVVLADCLNFSEAAERLYLTQPTLSKHVAAAERELGLRIFERSTSKVELTEAGRVFIDGLGDALDRYDRAVYAARLRVREPGEPVRVVGPLFNERISGVVAQAHESLCGEGMAIRMVRSDIGVRDCFEGLAEGRFDIAIAFRYGRRRRGIHLERLFDLPFGIACRSDHRLARKERLVFADLVGQRLFSYPLAGRAGYHEYVARVCRKHGIDAAAMEHAEEGAICLPTARDQVVFGVHFPGYARTGGDMVTRPLDEVNDVFEVCAARRQREDRSEVLALYDAIVRGAEG